MKRIVLTAMIAAFSFSAIQAQDAVAKKTKEESNIHFQKAVAGLNLSEEQKIKMKSLQEAHQQQMAEVKKEGISQEKIEAIRKEQHEQLLSILTADQKAELEKVKEERKDTPKVKTALAEQKKTPAANQQQEIAAKIKAIQQDETLTQEQKNVKTKELVQLLKESKKNEVSAEEVEKFKQQKKHTLEKKTTEK